jgi:D-alanyl-D-alanine carboxypeptidase
MLRALMVAIVLATALGIGGNAQAAPQASIVVDMRNGKVLYARSADRKQHPASLTKMMTLYLTFEAVRDGRLRLDQKVRVSRHAARQPASKLYLKTGQRVTVRSLIRATAIKSANDAAMVLAEAIGGSQREFARMMTRKARRLGMKNTTFKNPHGLTQRGHVSTARDMAKLGRHLFFDYPQYYNIFKRKTDYAAGKRIWTTNRLLSRYSGADGIKTGYTRAAGYNLVASASRGSKKIIAVVLGARNSAQRNKKAARLLDIGFSRAKRKVKRVKPSVVGRTRVAARTSPVPRRKPGSRSTGVAALAAAITPSAQAAVPRGRAEIIGGKPAPKVAELPVPRGGAKSEPVLAGVKVASMPIPIPRPTRLTQNGRLVPLASSAKRRDPPSWTAAVGNYADESSALTDLVRMSEINLPGQGASNFEIAKLRGLAGKHRYALRMPGLSRERALKVCNAVRGMELRCALNPSSRS